MKLIGKEAFGGSGGVEIHIPDSVEELCEACFYGCESLSRVTFGESSSLKLIGNGAFLGVDSLVFVCLGAFLPLVDHLFLNVL